MNHTPLVPSLEPSFMLGVVTVIRRCDFGES